MSLSAKDLDALVGFLTVSEPPEILAQKDSFRVLRAWNATFGVALSAFARSWKTPFVVDGLTTYTGHIAERAWDEWEPSGFLVIPVREGGPVVRCPGSTRLPRLADLQTLVRNHPCLVHLAIVSAEDAGYSFVLIDAGLDVGKCLLLEAPDAVDAG